MDNVRWIGYYPSMIAFNLLLRPCQLLNGIKWCLKAGLGPWANNIGNAELFFCPIVVSEQQAAKCFHPFLQQSCTDNTTRAPTSPDGDCWMVPPAHAARTCVESGGSKSLMLCFDACFQDQLLLSDLCFRGRMGKNLAQYKLKQVIGNFLHVSI